MRRFYIGAAIGIAITFLLPVEQVENFLRPIVNLIINIGRYFLLPTIFFGIVAGFAHQIIDRHEKKRGGVSKKKQATKAWFSGLLSEPQSRDLHIQVFLTLLLTTVLLVVIGGGGVLLFSLPRLSIIFQEFEPIMPLGLEGIFSLTFPQNIFSIFAQNGNFILPIAAVALLLGIAIRQHLTHNSVLPKATVELSDIFYNMLTVYTNLLGIGMILISAYITVQMRSIENVELFYQFILIISALTVGIILVVYPLIAVALRCRTRPVKLIRSIFGSIIISVLSGDSYFSSIMVLRLFRTRFSANKSIPYTLTTMGMIFSKSGSAFVASVVFFMVLKSYIAIEITFLNTVWIMGMIIIFSPLASTSPKLGAIHLLVTVMTLYGSGLENGFLIIVPLLPFLISIATLLDTLTIAFFGYLIADKLEFPYSALGDSKRIKRS